MKKFIALFLVFSILAISSNLYAKERRGAELIILKKDGQQVGGELIAVKQNSLLLKDSESGADASVDIKDIKKITIVKKSMFWKGVLYGLLIGGGGGAMWGATNPGTDAEAWVYSLALAAVFGPPGALIGGIIGVVAGKDKTIQIEGKSDLEIKEVLEKLRTKARIRDYK